MEMILWLADARRSPGENVKSDRRHVAGGTFRRIRTTRAVVWFPRCNMARPGTQPLAFIGHGEGNPLPT